MSLQNFLIARQTVGDGTSSFAVRGLSLADILPVFSQHKQAFRSAFNKGVEQAKENGFTAALITDAAMVILETAPEAFATLIANAADEPEFAPVVLQLPTGVQINAITAILELTSISEAEVKKLAEVVANLAGQVLAVTEFANSHSTTGSSDSANK